MTQLKYDIFPKKLCHLSTLLFVLRVIERSYTFQSGGRNAAFGPTYVAHM
jgi:hypothetical protein